MSGPSDFWRLVAEFLSPPPQTMRGLIGIRKDLAEFGGSFKAGLQLLSNLLHDRPVRDEPGINSEVLDFVKKISAKPQIWTDFPLPLEDDFEMSRVQRKHALAIEQLAPMLRDLRVELESCINLEQFWRIYFIFLLSHLNEHDAELLSSPEITEPRDALVQTIKQQQLHNSKKPDTSEDATKTQGENSLSQEHVVDDVTIDTSYTHTCGVAQRTVEHKEQVLFMDDYLSAGSSSIDPIREIGTSTSSGSSDWVRVSESQSLEEARQPIFGGSESDWVLVRRAQKARQLMISGESESEWVQVTQ